MEIIREKSGTFFNVIFTKYKYFDFRQKKFLLSDRFIIYETKLWSSQRVILELSRRLLIAPTASYTDSTEVSEKLESNLIRFGIEFEMVGGKSKLEKGQSVAHRKGKSNKLKEIKFWWQ